MRAPGDTLLARGSHLLAVLIMIAGLNVWSAPSQREERRDVRREAEAGSAGHEDPSSTAEWPMVAANPQRTSWTPEEVRGQLAPVWYRPIEPYIPLKVQIIAANGLLYVSTARGLYALDAATGDVAWVYPTELPLGHSPTVFNGVAYVGGLDRRLHAVNASTGEGIWTFEAGAGFSTNPLVLGMDGHVQIYAGNRDGNMYALEDMGDSAALMWKHSTGGPILFSAAHLGGIVYFASSDSHAYALDADNGTLVWKSAKLPGAGFHSWWPVLYENAETGADIVVLAGSNNYRHYLAPAYGADLQNREVADVFSDRWEVPQGTLIGQRYPDGTIDATRILQYLEEKPWRRTYLVLDQATGEEVTFDFDSDGKPEYAPMLWHGTHSGNRYPPVVGIDDTLYQSNVYMSDPWIPGGHVAGWNFGTNRISSPSTGWKAMDEPLAYSAGGSLVYWNHCNDRSAGAIDLTRPGTEWTYFSYNLESLIPGYNLLYEAVDPNDYTWNNLYKGSTSSSNGVYGQHGDQNPPIPYQGRVYMHRSNTIIAFGTYDSAPTALPMAPAVSGGSEGTPLTWVELKERLAAEIQKMLNSGHLRPGYRSVGLFDGHTRDQLGDHLIDYWHQPSDTLFALSLALPHLPVSMQQEVLAYLRAEYAAYPPYRYTHTGWKDGAARDSYDLPLETEEDRFNHPSWVSGWAYRGWTWPPHMFYALWKYAKAVGGARTIFDAARSRLEPAPPDSYLIAYPYVHNAYVAGYLGYLELEKLAGDPESVGVRSELERLLDLRAATFSKDTPFVGDLPDRTLSVARNFVFLVPELGQYLRDNALARVRAAVDEYDEVAPYWFVANYEAAHGEGALQHLYDYHALFLARAYILQEPRAQLSKYLDVPGVQVGDLFYIQNLVAAIEAPPYLSKSSLDRCGEQGDAVSYALGFTGIGSTLTLTDSLPSGVSAPTGFGLEGTSVMPVYDEVEHRLTWSDSPALDQEVTIRYTVTVTTPDRSSLVNAAQLADQNRDVATATALLIANPYRTYLPLVSRTR
jgi:outer membrane protein assembly factor BamB